MTCAVTGTAFLTNDFLDDGAVRRHVWVDLDSIPAVLNLWGWCSYGDSSWQPPAFRASSARTPLLGRTADPSECIALRKRFVEQIDHGQAQALGNFRGRGVAAVAVQKHHAAAMTVDPAH